MQLICEYLGAWETETEQADATAYYRLHNTVNTEQRYVLS